MSESYSKDIENLLVTIEIATGMNQGEISKDMGYAANYLSTAIGRGGNKKLLEKIKQKYASILSENKKPSEPDLADQAVLKALLTDYIKLKAQLTKRSVNEVADELDQNTKLILRELKKGSL
jgi:hypothetical protein